MAGLADKTMEKSGKMKAAKVVGILFMSRTYSHMAHLKTPSYSKHKALNAFYDEIVDLADSIAEVSQGVWGKLNIPFVAMEGNVNDPIGTLTMHMDMVMKQFKDCEIGALKNIGDEIQALYLKTLYLMKELS